MPARLVKTKTGGWKIRFRDGTKNPKTGRLIERSSQVFGTKGEASAYARTVDEQQRLRRELRRKTNRAVMSFGAVVERYLEHRLAHGKLRADYATEVRKTLTDLARARKWRTTLDVTADGVDAWIREKAGIKDVMDVQQRATALLAARGIDKPLAQLKTLLHFARGTLRQVVDPVVLDLAKPKRPEKPKPPLLTVSQVVDIVLPTARELGGDDYGEHTEGICDHARTYGHRWYSLCLVDVSDFDARRGRLLLRHTKNGEPLTVDLLQRHVERYRRLVQGRPPHDPLFLSPNGERWRCHGKATQLVDWYRANIAPLLPANQRQSYQLKDHAVAEMRRAGIPDQTILAISGIRTREVLDRYDSTNVSELALALHALAARQEREGGASAPQVRPA